VSFARAVQFAYKFIIRWEEFMNKDLIRYSMQIAMLKQLLARKMISEKEYAFAKKILMRDYKVISDITA